MIPTYRKYIPKIFIIFSILIIPITLYLSSGNVFNSDQFTFSKSMTLKFNTIPGFVNLKVNNSKIGLFNSDLRVSDGVTSEISLSKDDFVEEVLQVHSPKSLNSSLAYDPYYLLPKISNEIKSELSVIRLIDSNLGIGTKDSKTYLFNYDFTGIKNQYLIDSTNKEIDFKDNSIQKLNDKSFYFVESNILVYANQDSYKMLDLNNLPIKVKKIAKFVDNKILINTVDNKLYDYNISDMSYTFLTDGVYDLQPLTDNNVGFVYSDIGIFRIQRGDLINQDQFIVPRVSYKLPLEGYDLTKTNQRTYDSSNYIYQSEASTVLKFNNKLFVNQEGIKGWKLVDSNVLKQVIVNNKVFILDNNLDLKVLDLTNQFYSYIATFAKMESNTLKLVYSSQWSRIMLYTDENVQSIPISSQYVPYLATSPVISLKPTLWLRDQSCFAGIIEKSQYCTNGKNLLQYRNVNLINGF